MIFASTSIGKLKVVGCEPFQIQKNYYHDHAVLCLHNCHNKRVCTQAGTDLLQRAALCRYSCNELVSLQATLCPFLLHVAALVRYPLLIGNCVKPFRPTSAFSVWLHKKHQVFLFRFLSDHAESHISTSNISEFFYGVILAQCSCTVPKDSWTNLAIRPFQGSQ